MIYKVPLRLPRVLLQLGHLWVTSCNESMQQGIQEHGQHTNKNRIHPKTQAVALASDSVEVRIWFWQWGHCIWTGSWPKYTGACITTTGGAIICWGGGACWLYCMFFPGSAKPPRNWENDEVKELSKILFDLEHKKNFSWGFVIFTWLFYGTSCSYRTSWSHRTSWSYRTPCSFEFEWMIIPIQCHAFGLFFRTRQLTSGHI